MFLLVTLALAAAGGGTLHGGPAEAKTCAKVTPMSAPVCGWTPPEWGASDECVGSTGNPESAAWLCSNAPLDLPDVPPIRGI